MITIKINENLESLTEEQGQAISRLIDCSKGILKVEKWEK